MIKSLLATCLLASISLAQVSGGYPGWNDLTVNGLGSSTFSDPALPPIALAGVSNIHFEISTSHWDAGSPTFFIIGAPGSISPGAVALGFGQCTTVDIDPLGILYTVGVGTVPATGPFVLDVPLPVVQHLEFTVQAAVIPVITTNSLFLSQAHTVTVTGV